MTARSFARVAPGGVGLAVSIALTVGCARIPARSDAVMPDLSLASSQPRCDVRHSADKPLVIEWPAADRAALEARSQRGLVAVRYQGCTMEVLTSCTIEGRYDYAALSPKREQVKIRNADELYARLPLGAASLEGKLEVSGQLVVDMAITGQQQADRHVVDHDELVGHCEGATHLLTGLTVGAFTLHAGAATSVGAEAKAASVGAGGSHERSRQLLASDGDPVACAASEHDGLAPAAQCGALLRVEAVPLAGDPPERDDDDHDEDDHLAGYHHVPTAAERRESRRAAAWRGTAITSGVLTGASMGGIMGGTVLLVQANSQDPWEEPTADDLRRKEIGTGMLIGSFVGVIGFGALTIAASISAKKRKPGRMASVSPTVGRSGAGVMLQGRF